MENADLKAKITQNEQLFRQFRETYERDLAQFENLKRENAELKSALNMAVDQPKNKQYSDHSQISELNRLRDENENLKRKVKDLEIKIEKLENQLEEKD